MVSVTAAPPTYALHILFIGNSFTFFNDIPKQLVDIASSDPGNPTQFTVQSVTRGGIGLKELWDDGNAVAAIRANHWDYVVLQQHSGWALEPAWILDTMDYSKRFNEVIRQAGAKTLLYLTWPNKPGSHWYTDPHSPDARNPNYMLKQFITHTYELAEKLGAQTVDVGVYWQYVLAQQPGIEMYVNDAHHPSMAGSYLSALVFYKTLTGRDVMKIPFQPPGVSADAIEKIKAIVAQPLAGR